MHIVYQGSKDIQAHACSFFTCRIDRRFDLTFKRFNLLTTSVTLGRPIPHPTLYCMRQHHTADMADVDPFTMLSSTSPIRGRPCALFEWGFPSSCCSPSSPSSAVLPMPHRSRGRPTTRRWPRKQRRGAPSPTVLRYVRTSVQRVGCGGRRHV